MKRATAAAPGAASTVWTKGGSGTTAVSAGEQADRARPPIPINHLTIIASRAASSIKKIMTIIYYGVGPSSMAACPVVAPPDPDHEATPARAA